MRIESYCKPDRKRTWSENFQPVDEGIVVPKRMFMIETKIVQLENGNWLYAHHIFDESYGKHRGASMFTFRFPEHSKIVVIACREQTGDF
jgi:hypothetical protein